MFELVKKTLAQRTVILTKFLMMNASIKVTLLQSLQQSIQSIILSQHNDRKYPPFPD